MYIKRRVGATGLAVAVAFLPLRALADIQLHSAPLKSSSVPCVQTTVESVKVYQTGAEEPAVAVEFNTNLGVAHFPNMKASIDDEGLYVPSSTGWADSSSRQALPNPIALQEHAGQKVQLCLMRVPKPDPSCTRDFGCCHPDRDWRGRVYRVYDYRLRASYESYNSHHDCGGA